MGMLPKMHFFSGAFLILVHSVVQEQDKLDGKLTLTCGHGLLLCYCTCMVRLVGGHVKGHNPLLASLLRICVVAIG